MTLEEALTIFVYLNNSPERAEWNREAHFEAFLIVEKHALQLLLALQTGKAQEKDKHD